MNEREPGLLLCTNGAQEGRSALDYGAWVAQVVGLPVTLLGIVESQAASTAVEQALRNVESRLEANGVMFSTIRSEGDVREVLAERSVPEQHLVVIGSLGRPAWQHWIHGSSFRRLMPDLRVPLLYVPGLHCRLERVLVATGALGYASSAESWALHLARCAGATLTILHVAEPVVYHYPTSDQMEAHWRNLLQTDIPQARHLRALLEQAQGLNVTARLQVRQGTLVREIIAEARQGGHDLVVMGSKHSSHSLRRLYLPDVTAEVMEALATPVLAVQTGQKCFLADRHCAQGVNHRPITAHRQSPNDETDPESPGE